MKEWLIRLILMALGIIIPVVGLEFALGLFGPHIEPPTPGYTEADKDLGWRGVPNGEANIKRTGMEIPLRRNSLGFRDAERTYEKKEGTFRIVVLGDSFIEAKQVRFEDTFPYLLEQEMNSDGDKKFEVVNLAISGYGTGQEYVMLRNEGLKFHPDFVVLALYIGNDILECSSTLSGSQYRRPYFVLKGGKLEERPFTIKDEKEGVPLRGMKARFKTWLPNTYYFLANRIYATPWLRNFLGEIGVFNFEPVSYEKSEGTGPFVQDWYAIYDKQYPPAWDNAWKVAESLFLEMKNELKARGIGFLVVVIPMEFEFKTVIPDKTPDKDPQGRPREFDARKPERILSSFFDENQIDYLLLRPEFQKNAKETNIDLYLQGPNEIHWNEKGHRYVAEMVHEKLNRLLTSGGRATRTR